MNLLVKLSMLATKLSLLLVFGSKISYCKQELSSLGRKLVPLDQCGLKCHSHQFCEERYGNCTACMFKRFSRRKKPVGECVKDKCDKKCEGDSDCLLRNGKPGKCPICYFKSPDAKKGVCDERKKCKEQCNDDRECRGYSSEFDVQVECPHCIQSDLKDVKVCASSSCEKDCEEDYQCRDDNGFGDCPYCVSVPGEGRKCKDTPCGKVCTRSFECWESDVKHGECPFCYISSTTSDATGTCVSTNCDQICKNNDECRDTSGFHTECPFCFIEDLTNDIGLCKSSGCGNRCSSDEECEGEPGDPVECPTCIIEAGRKYGACRPPKSFKCESCSSDRDCMGANGNPSICPFCVFNIQGELGQCRPSKGCEAPCQSDDECKGTVENPSDCPLCRNNALGERVCIPSTSNMCEQPCTSPADCLNSDGNTGSCPNCMIEGGATIGRCSY